MTSMFDRLAEAAYDASPYITAGKKISWSQLTDAGKARSRSAVLTLIEAMRVPSGDVILAGIEADTSHEMAGRRRDESSASDVWEAMIDKIMEGKP